MEKTKTEFGEKTKIFRENLANVKKNKKKLNFPREKNCKCGQKKTILLVKIWDSLSEKVPHFFRQI